MKLRKGDPVIVITGKDKGREGQVSSVFPKQNKVIVHGVNTAKKHAKARKANTQGGIIDKDMPIDASNVAYVHKGKPTRLGYRIESDGTKVARRPLHRGRDPMSTATTTVPRLKQKYNDEIRDALQEQLGLGNVMQVPKLDKIVINMGVGRATQQPSLLEGAVEDLTAIAGQKPIVTKARISIAAFKLREGQSIGTKVTLRGDRMWEFLDRLIAVAIPRIRDFRGLPAHSWDGRGNYTFGVNEQTIFPEIDYDRIDTTRGMDITIVTTAVDDAGGKALLDAYGFPFKKGADDAAAVQPKKRRGPARGGPKGKPSGKAAAAGGRRRSDREGAVEDGQEGADQQSAGEAQVQGACLHPLSAVRPFPLGLPQVRAVPHLLARARTRRRSARRDQGELVRSST